MSGSKSSNSCMSVDGVGQESCLVLFHLRASTAGDWDRADIIIDGPHGWARMRSLQ